VLVRLNKTGLILLTIDAVPFGEGFTPDEQSDDSNPDAEAIRASTIKLLDLVEREHIGLVIFSHDMEQWKTLKNHQSLTCKATLDGRSQPTASQPFTKSLPCIKTAA